ncbi:MAG: hypothetical protein K1X94_07215 [Sandaracinaceae bacterium]|nr:hypothetical protein [Sandaracinaceae bacterium]
MSTRALRGLGLLLSICAACGGARDDGHAQHEETTGAETLDERSVTAESVLADSVTITAEPNTTDLAPTTAIEPVAEPLPEAPGLASEAVAAEIGSLERQIDELDALIGLFARAREAASLEADGIPPLCEDSAPIEAIRVHSTAGGTGSTLGRDLLHEVELFCEPFRRWAHPDARLEALILHHAQGVDRVASDLEQILRCPAETAAACGTIGRVDSSVQAEARRALALVVRHQAELEPARRGTAPLACTTPALEQIAHERWGPIVSHTRVAELPRATLYLCSGLGVAPAQREALRVELGRRFDHVERSARSERRMLSESLAAGRAYVR